MDIPINLIDDFPFRMNTSSDVSDLAKSISLQGQLSPIRVRPHPVRKGRYEIIYGNRRLAALRSLGKRSVTADIVTVSDAESCLMVFAENSERKDFSDFEKGIILEKYHTLTGKSYDEIAKLLGKSPALVSQHVSMLKLFSDVAVSEEEKNSVANSLTERHARLLLKIEDAMERWNTAKLVVRANLCVRELQRILPRPKRKQEQPSSYLWSLVLKIIDGINASDLRPLLEARSRSDFSLFDDFPPFLKMDRDIAEEHVVNISRIIRQSQMTAEDLEVKVRGELGYATMYVSSLVNLAAGAKRVRSRVTMIFSKEQDWKIVHEHWSPIDPIIQLDYTSVLQKGSQELLT